MRNFFRKSAFLALIVFLVSGGCRSTFDTTRTTPYQGEKVAGVCRLVTIKGVPDAILEAVSNRYPGTPRYITIIKTMNDTVLVAGEYQLSPDYKAQLTCELFVFGAYEGVDPSFVLPHIPMMAEDAKGWAEWQPRHYSWGTFNQELVLNYYQNLARTQTTWALENKGSLGAAHIQGVLNFCGTDYAKEVLTPKRFCKVKLTMEQELVLAKADHVRIMAKARAKAGFQALTPEQQEVYETWAGNFMRLEPANNYLFAGVIFDACKLPLIGKHIESLRKATGGDYEAGLVLVQTGFLSVCPLPYFGWRSDELPLLISTLAVGLKGWKFWRTSTSTAFQADALATWPGVFAKGYWGYSLQKARGVEDMPRVVKEMNAQGGNQFPPFINFLTASPAEMMSHVDTHWPLISEARNEEIENKARTMAHFFGLRISYGDDACQIDRHLYAQELQELKDAYNTGTPYKGPVCEPKAGK